MDINAPRVKYYLKRSIVDVEGFGRFEVTPPLVTPCVSRSAGPTCPGAAPSDGNTVGVGGD